MSTASCSRASIPLSFFSRGKGGKGGRRRRERRPGIEFLLVDWQNRVTRTAILCGFWRFLIHTPAFRIAHRLFKGTLVFNRTVLLLLFSDLWFRDRRNLSDRGSFFFLWESRNFLTKFFLRREFAMTMFGLESWNWSRYVFSMNVKMDMIKLKGGKRRKKVGIDRSTNSHQIRILRTRVPKIEERRGRGNFFVKHVSARVREEEQDRGRSDYDAGTRWTTSGTSL